MGEMEERKKISRLFIGNFSSQIFPKSMMLWKNIAHGSGLSEYDRTILLTIHLLLIKEQHKK